MLILKYFENTGFQTCSGFCVLFDSDLSKLGHLKMMFPLTLAVDAGNYHMRCIHFWYFRCNSTE